MALVVKVRLPFRLGFARRKAVEPVVAAPDVAVLHAEPAATEPGPAPAGSTAPPSAGASGTTGTEALAGATRFGGMTAAALEDAPEADAPAVDDADDVVNASATLVWLAYTSALASRATTLEDAALAALEGRLDTGPRRRAARETHKLATSLWLVEARDAARLAWEAAGLLDPGTLLGTANALRLSQIVEALHTTLRTLPPPEALSPAGRAQSPYLVVVDDDDTLARELPIEAAVRGWRAKVIRHLGEPLDDRAAVIVLGPDVLGDADAVARNRLLAAHPDAAVATLSTGPSLLERSGAHAGPAHCAGHAGRRSHRHAAATAGIAADHRRRHRRSRPAGHGARAARGLRHHRRGVRTLRSGVGRRGAAASGRLRRR